MARYATVAEVKDILHSSRGKFVVDPGSTVTDSGVVNEQDIENWIDRAMMKLHSIIRPFFNPSLSLPINSISKVPDELRLATQLLTAALIRTKALAGHRMQEEIDTGVSSWLSDVKQLMVDLVENIKAGAYASAKDSSATPVLLFSWANTPQWQSTDAYITEKLGIPDIGAGRVANVDNQEIGLRDSDIWDTVFEDEG